MFLFPLSIVYYLKAAVNTRSRCAGLSITDDWKWCFFSPFEFHNGNGWCPPGRFCFSANVDPTSYCTNKQFRNRHCVQQATSSSSSWASVRRSAPGHGVSHCLYVDLQVFYIISIRGISIIIMNNVLRFRIIIGILDFPLKVLYPKDHSQYISFLIDHECTFDMCLSPVIAVTRKKTSSKSLCGRQIW